MATVKEAVLKSDPKLTKCLKCGNYFRSKRYGISGEDDTFICGPCYQDLLCPALKISDTEILDEKETTATRSVHKR